MVEGPGKGKHRTLNNPNGRNRNAEGGVQQARLEAGGSKAAAPGGGTRPTTGGASRTGRQAYPSDPCTDQGKSNQIQVNPS